MKFKSKMFFLTLSMVLLMSSTGYATDEMGFSIGRALLKLLFYTLVLAFVLFITIYGTKFIAKNTRRFINSKYMKIIDILNLGNNAKIIIMEINHIIYIVAIANNTIEIVDKLPREEFDFHKDIDFEEQLDRYKNKDILDNKYFSKFQIKAQRILNKTNKFIDKEDEDNEKKC
jgi:flagellar biogenesis protein FliO